MTDYGFLSVENVLEVTAPIPKAFSFRKEDWSEWISHFEQFRRATKLDISDEKVQVNALLSHMGPHTHQFLEELHCTDDCFHTYNELIKTIDEYFQKKVNVVLERAKFNTRAQRENEAAESYINAIARMARTCNYGELEAELIRDRLVVGIRDKKCSEALQMEENLTLDKAKSIVIQAENIKKMKNAHKAEKKKEEMGGGGGGSCSRCGAKPSHTLAACPAKDTKCIKCAQKGHLAKCCQSGCSSSNNQKQEAAQQQQQKNRTGCLNKENKEESFEFI